MKFTPRWGKALRKNQQEAMIDFENLAQQIKNTSEALKSQAAHAINRDVTARGWLTGFYIVEYEQHGIDRAKYGEQLIAKLAKRLDDKSMSTSYLKSARTFYFQYPELGLPIINFIRKEYQIGQSPIVQLKEMEEYLLPIGQSAIVQSQQTPHDHPVIDPELMFSRLSYTHLLKLMPITDTLQRSFYIISAIQGVWSVKELDRQIKTNYYIRSGWSKKPEKLAQMVNSHAERSSIKEDIKTPMVFEFLGLASKDVWEESDLEQSLIDHLQEFMLEMGKGFCFEARQKKILIDDDYHKVDLVFYNRIIKCHCLVELKAHKLDYTDVAQLNLYLNYYKKNEMQPDDNPPVGILLCTEVGSEMVEYATAGMNDQMFITRYELQLPSREKIMEFLRKENKTICN